MQKFNAIYIAGPITGIEGNNLEAFKIAQDILRQHFPKHKIIVPHEIFDHLDTRGFEHGDFMNYCISDLALVDTVVTIPGWDESVGAKIEVQVARLLGKDVQNIVTFQKMLEPILPQRTP